MTDSQPPVNRLLWKAIEERRLIRLRYNDRERIVEPHDYGVQNGVVKLLAYQVAGSSKHKLPNWRWLRGRFDVQHRATEREVRRRPTN